MQAGSAYLLLQHPPQLQMQLRGSVLLLVL
jgi:hypothetical protein